ncbi:type II toxin-antitoxin system VapC family toxin [Candidatus Uhrbacteria bacterium]|nr:type II toxin-antitoxin system VapC family toxin [Candidatus Uhrbacteria bacterium]
MATGERIFIDSNYLVALFNPADSLHIHAKKIATQLDITKRDFVVSNFIFLEIVTVLSLRQGRRSACEAGEYLHSPSIEMIHIDYVLQRETWNIFHSVQVKDVSFVDCSIIAVMYTEGIDTLLTFDSHFKKLQRDHRFKLYPC